MAKEPKTKPTDAPPAEFIATVPDPRRRAEAETALAMMEEVTGERAVMWGPSIVGFGAYQGPTGAWPVAAFSPRKAQMVFYVTPGFDRYRDLLDRLGKHSTGAGCLYIPRLADVDADVLRQIIVDSTAWVRETYPAVVQ